MSDEIREIAVRLCAKNRAWVELDSQKWELNQRNQDLASNLREKIETLDKSDDIVAECLKIATIKRRIEQIEEEHSQLSKKSYHLWQEMRKYEQQLDEATVALAVA